MKKKNLWGSICNKSLLGILHAYSLYTDQNILDHFLRDSRIACSEKEHFVICSPYRPNDQVYHVNKSFNNSVPIFFFVYDVFFTTLGLRLPFTDFEVEHLNFINVAAFQLYPTSWAFIQSFEILMQFLGQASLFLIPSQRC